MSQQQAEAIPLAWGDIVRIHGVNLTKKTGSQGLIISKGFTDRNLYYQKYDELKDVNFFRQSLFQILPRSNFDMNDKLIEQTDKKKIQGLKKKAQIQVENLYKVLDSTVEDAKQQKSQKGAQQNEQIMKKGLILYGNQIILKHMESNAFLKGLVQAAQSGGDGAFKVQLGSNPCSMSIFQITSHRTYIKDGDVVYYDDELQLFHRGSDCYTNFSEKADPIYLDDKSKNIILPEQNHPSYHYYCQRPASKRPKDIRINIINQNKSKCLWKFIRHCDYEQSKSKQLIKSHDIVYFKHTANGGLIASNLCYEYYFLKQFETQSESFDCYWQLIPKEGSKSNRFWARSIITGKMLKFKDFDVQIQPDSKEDDSNKKGFQNQSLVKLRCNQDEYLMDRGQSIFKKQDDLPIIQQFESKIHKFEFQAVKELGEDSFSINRVDQNTMMDIGFVISSHQPIVKFLEIISSGLLQHEKQDDPKYSRFFKKWLDQDSLLNMCKILTSLSGRIYGTSYEDIESSGNVPLSQVQKILVQTGVAQLAIEIIYHLFKPYVFIQSDTQPSDDRPIRNKIYEIFQYSYRLLQKIAAENMQNRIYMSRWVNLFLEHSNQIDQSYIQDCLVGILQNNPKSIELTINEQIIINLIQACFAEIRKVKGGQYLTTKYLKLFSTFIKCQDRVLKQNQNIILNKFFKNQDNEMSFRFKVEAKQDIEEDTYGNDFSGKLKAKQVVMAFNRQEFCTIKRFYKDWKSRWNYFIAYVNLLADICMDRNSQAIQNVSALLSLNIVVIILLDNQLDQLNDDIMTDQLQGIKKGQGKKYPILNIRQPFLRVAHYVYIKNDKFSKIKRIKKISNWYKYQGKEGPIIEQINKTKRPFEGQKEQEEKKYLMEILGFIKSYLLKCDQNPFNLSMLYTILNTLEQTIMLGLWEHIQSFRDMIPDIIMRITKIENGFIFAPQKEITLPKQLVEFNKRKLKMNKPQINQLIECKVKATKIFNFISEMEIDIRLRYMMNFFKGLYQATQKFENYNQQYQDNVKSQDSIVKTRNGIAKNIFESIDGSSILGNNVKKISQDQQIMMKQNIWYNKLKQMTPFEYKQTDDPIKNRYLFESVVKSNSCKFQDIVLSLFELTSYNNCSLLKNTLSMVNNMFQQRKSLIENMKAILICGKGNLYQVYRTLKYTRVKFDILANPEILKQQQGTLIYKFWKPYDHQVKLQPRRSGIIQDLFFLSRTLKQNISLKNIDALMYVDQTIFQGGSFTYLNEREKNNQLFQSVNLAEGIYQPLIQFIKIAGTNQLLRIHKNILFSIYQYLTLLCFNNLEVKQVLMQFIPDIIPHLSKRVGASNFLYQVSVNNKLLVNDQEMVDLIINGALDACMELSNDEIAMTTLFRRQLDESQSHNQYQKSKILFSLRGILIFNEQGIKKNQQKLMNKIQDNKYRMLIFTGSTPYVQKLQNFNLSPKQFYISTVFELFSVLVQSKNSINIGKLENVHKYPYLLQCLKQANRWQIRRSIRSYLNRLYYVNKDRDIFIFDQFIRQEFAIINKQFFDLIQLHKSKMLTDQLKIQKGIRFKYAKSQIMLMIIELLISLHQILLKPEFNRMLTNKINKEKIGNDKKTHDQLIKLLRNLGCMNKLYPRTKPIAPFIRQIKKLLQVPFSVISIGYLEKRSQPQSNIETSQMDDLVQITSGKYIYDHSKTFFRNLHDMIRQLKAKEKMQKIKQEYLQSKLEGGQIPEEKKRQRFMELIFSAPGEPTLKPVDEKGKDIPKTLKYNPGIQTANSKIFKVLAKPQLDENQENFELNRKLSIVKEMVDDMAIFRKFQDDEFIKLVSIFEGLDQTSKVFYTPDWDRQGETAIPVFSMNQMISTTFQLIMNNPDKFADKQKIFFIKLIRCYLTEAIQKDQDYKLPVDQWGQYQDVEGFTDQNTGQDISQLTQFKNRQKRIKDCGGSAFIIQIFKQNFTGNRLQLLNQALLLGIAYLYTGNTECQDSLLQELKKDPQNKMMININKIILTIGQFLINIRKIKEGQKKRNFAYLIVDTYDFYSLEDKNLMKQFGHSANDKYQAIIQSNFQKALCRTFRFLQLFCQNNNVGMKDFILTQTNEDGNSKDSSINFILTTTNLLRSIFKNMNSKLVSIPKNLLDFLTQTTQTPCIKNQIALLKSTFYQDVSYMAQFFYKQKENLLNRKFNKIPLDDNDPLHSLIEIYEMSMNLILINFQGNDDLLIWQFLSKCQPVFFWQIIRQNLLSLLKEQDRVQAYGIQPEDEGDDDKLLTQKLFNAFDIHRITQLVDQEKQKQNNFEGPMDIIIRTLCIFKKINDYANKLKQSIDKDPQNANKQQVDKEKFSRQFKEKFVEIAAKEFPAIQQFLDYFENLILQIQVYEFNGNEDILQQIYFVNQPVFSFLSKQTKDSIMKNVTRQTQRDKLRTLLDYRQQVNKQIENNYNLNYNKFTIFGKQKKIPITAQNTQNVRNYARNISSVIILLMAIFIFVDHDLEDQSSIFTYNNIFEKLVIKIFCIIQLFTTFLYCYLWLKLRKPLALNKLEKDQAANAVQKEAKECDQLPPPQPSDGWGQLSVLIHNYWTSFIENFKFISDFYYESFLYRLFIRPFYALFVYQSSEFLPILAFLFAALAGNYYGVEWYTIHIFDYFASISIMANVFKSIFNNVGVLTLLSCVVGVFILVFNIISLSTYSHVLWEQDIPQQACQSILDCVLVMYTQGAVGGDMQQFQLGRFCFDIGYIVFMEMLFSNIVGGIIMDSYSSLRETDDSIDQDKSNKCYICGMDKPNMEKIGQTFTKHTRGRHFLWNYIYYVYTLEKKSSTDYSGIEYKIKEKIEKQDVTWFPSLGQGENQPDIQQLMNGLEQNVDSMNEKSKAVIEKNNQYLEAANSALKVIGSNNKKLKVEGLPQITN